MASVTLLCFFLCALSPLLLSSSVSSHSHETQAYIVYMGGSLSSINEGEADIGAAESAHLELLSTLLSRENRERRVSLGHVYHHAIRGFSAMLTKEEAALLSGHEEIVSVFPDPKVELHTTRSWDFVEEESLDGIGTQSNNQFQHEMSSDVIIGMIDSGIWPESPSFSDVGIGEIPKRWRGVCMEGFDFKRSNCNRKLIGARYYNNQYNFTHRGNTNTNDPNDSPRDHNGHGTHTASTAAGVPVTNASYFGLAQGTARGGLPSARIAVYKACLLEGCHGSTILKAIDDAVKDGVDLLSISLGMSSFSQANFLEDPIAIGAFHATRMGIMVVCSAGNEGPDPYTVGNTAPWIFTVAASNIDREFKSTVILGNGTTFEGSSINFSNLSRSSRYPLVFAGDVAADFTPQSEASNCYPGSLNPEKIAGKIIVCENNYPSVGRRIKKLVVEDAGARGLIYISDAEIGDPFDSGPFPFAQVKESEGIQILKYINSTREATATIFPAVTVQRARPAPVVADFSSRGPAQLTENILKPDIMAPGVAILAAHIPSGEERDPMGEKPSKFGIKSGTSMACPHVTGAAAFIKSMQQRWTPSMIKSALMTTASISNNMEKILTNSSGAQANPHETGVGEVHPFKALDPGLVFATTTEDYLNFLCYYGFPEKRIRALSNTPTFNCPRVSSDSLISTINYPSISIGELQRNQMMKVTRQVTNVGSPNATYKATVHAPPGLWVKVTPEKIAFHKNLTKVSFNVSFYGKHAHKGYNYGSLTWSDVQHNVRVVFAVNII